MTTVYLVSKGSYSDYHIVGVYSTMDKAKEACEVWTQPSRIVRLG